MSQRVIFLNDDILHLLRRQCHHARRGHDVTLLYGTTDGTTSTVDRVISPEEPARERAKLLSLITERGLVQVGQSRLVTETLHTNPSRPAEPADEEHLITPPENYVFVIRHRVGGRSIFHAATIKNDILTNVNVDLTTSPKRPR